MIRSILSQWAATLYVGLVSMSLSIFIARKLGPVAFGEYSVALAVGAVLVIFIDGGMRNILLRERVRASLNLQYLADKLFSIALGHAFIVALICSLLSIIFLTERMSLVLATIWCFFGTVLAQYISAIFRGEGRLALDAVWLMGQRSFSAVCIVTAIFFGFYSPWHIFAAWAIGTITIDVVYMIYVKYKPSFVFKYDLYKVVLPLLWIDLATVVYFRSDMIMMQWLGLSEEKIGQYAAAYRLIEAVILLTNPVAILIFRYFRKNIEVSLILGQQILRAIVLAVLLGIAGAVIITVFANTLIEVTYGSKYYESVRILVILAWAMIFVLPNAVLTQVALALNLEHAYALAASLAAVCNVVLNFIFIPQYGLISAAYATIMTEAVLLIVLVIALIKKFKNNPVFD